MFDRITDISLAYQQVQLLWRFQRKIIMIGRKFSELFEDLDLLDQACQTCGPLQAHLRPAQRIL
jgi:hypothetical protein